MIILTEKKNMDDNRGKLWLVYTQKENDILNLTLISAYTEHKNLWIKAQNLKHYKIEHKMGYFK